ncbi:mucin-19 isoform X2 [Anopheles stephensi]|uniref:mucin-19 isoform X2 n=1 Tax=Anopheles stephensi TaxID=30069 RepID=UPI001658A8A8|nr:mucin-19 isoform X2 [Anopheles stephensi]
MNSGERDLTEIDGRRIIPCVSVSDGQEKQQVATIVGEDAVLAKQPVHFFSNHHQQQPLTQQTNAPNGERTTLHANINQNRANATLPGTTTLQAVLNAASSRISEKNVENSNSNALTDGGNGVPEPDELLLYTTTTVPEQSNTGSIEQIFNHGRPGSSNCSAMRDPQESHHRSIPTAGGPLGEVESGEDDNDCVVVLPSSERKVEPLKINLARDREPLRTVIKLTPGASSTPDSFQQLSPTIRDVPGSPKITIKPPKPPQTVESSLMVVGGSAGSSAPSSASQNNAEHHTNNCVGSTLPSYSSIPKLTIKPIINPANDTASVCETGSSAAGGTVALSVEQQMHIIPKLLIKGSVSSLDPASHGRDGAVEPHIVPKLTIRGVNNHNHQQQQQQHHYAQSQSESQVYPNDGGIPSAMLLMDGGGGGGVGGRGESSRTPGSPTPLVPKLTIKMDNHHPVHLHHHHHHNSLRVKDVPDVAEGGGPIPKLHIKAIQQDGAALSAGVNNSSSSSGGCSTSSTGSSPVLTSSEGVKLTIKPLPEPPKLPKLTIKTTGLGTVAETSDVSMVSSTSNSFSPKLLPSMAACSSSSGEHLQQHQQVMGGSGASLSHPLLQQQLQHQQPASPSDQHSNISSSSIPKLTIKPMPPKDAVAPGGQDCVSDANNPSSNLLTPTVPKLTIKPILPPTKQSAEDSSSSSEISINSLESSPISSSSISSAPASSSSAAALATTSPPSALRMTIKVPSSAGQQPQLHESRDLVGMESASSMSTGGVSASLATGTVVTRLNIKPILPPPAAAAPSADCDRREAELGSLENKNAQAHTLVNTSDDGDSTPTSCEETRKPIVIPKVTIKTLANPGSQETEILSTPKVTLKPIPKPQEDAVATGNALDRHLMLSTGLSSVVTNNASHHSPTNSTTGSGLPDASDSPRIILKINKGSSSTTTTSGEQLDSATTGADGGQFLGAVPPVSGGSILANELKRPASNALCTSAIPSSSSGSSSVSCASSTSVSASATSSSAGSDPASPSSGGGGDQGELVGSHEMKRSKLDHSQSQQLSQHMQGVLDQHQGLMRQTMLQTQHHPYQLQLPTGTPNKVSDVIVIDDDSKSENETVAKEKDQTAASVSRLPSSATEPPTLANNEGAVNRTSFPSLADGGTSSVPVKQRRTRGTPRGAGARQPRRGNGRSAVSALAKQQQLDASAAVSQLYGLLQDDREEGSSSDCMIVDEPAAPASNLRERLTLESLLRAGSKPTVPSSSSIAGSGNFYSNAPMSGVVGEVEKNGTASNSSIGSVASSVSSSVTVPASTTPVASGRTPAAGVRMSTRRAAGQLLKEVLANKHQDRDSGVDEARTDGEFGATPSKRARGRPKKQSVDLTAETNGGGNSNSVDGSIGGLEAVSSDSTMLAAMAMAMGSGGDGGSPMLRADDRGLLGSQTLMEGIMPLPRTPVRTPRTRARGRGRGRGRTNLMEPGNLYDGTLLAETASALAVGNVDPLFIGTTNTIDPAAGSTDATQGFQLLYNHMQTPRGGAGARTRGGRRGPGSRGPRTPRGGRGAARAAMAALLSAGADDTPSHDVIGRFANLTSAEQAATKQLLDTLQQQQEEQQQLLQQMAPQHSANAPDMTAKVRGRGRGARASGTPAGSTRRKGGTRGSTKAARGRKGLEMESPMLMTTAESSPAGAALGDASDLKNAIFMTPMAGGLDSNRPKLHVRALKTPRNEIKSNTPPSSAEVATPSTSSATASSRTLAADGTGPGGGGGGLQVFEEDTRMSGDFNFTTPMRLLSSGDGYLQQNEESQSSYLSSASVTQDAINQSSAANATASEDKAAAVAAGTANVVSADAQKESILAGATSASNSSSSSSRRPNKGKMEVLDSHRAQFTVDLLAEYEWPPPSPGTRGADTFMIQEQIAEYLGVKSFKRKYPDLMRRPVDMEERNFILEQGLASEKMCDLGLTAVYASEILDIMCTDYPEKYEEYTRYTREKHFRELSNRQRQQQEAIGAVVAAAPIDRAQLQKEKAIESAASWNCSFNKERRESRRACMDLQTYVVQLPKRPQPVRPEGHQQPAPKAPSTNYPVALVPGQFSEFYTTYTPEELACYPINTILLDPFELQEIVSSERYRRLVAAEEARLLEDSDSSSNSSSDSDDSSSDDSDTSSGSSGSSTDDDGSSSSDSSDSECGDNETRVKNERKRQQRKAGEACRLSAVGECEKSTEETAAPVAPTPAVVPVAVAAAPVTRSSRTLSTGLVVAPATSVECKEPTDSDDSDVPLIAHAVKKKNSLASATAPVPTATTTTTAGQPSAGGGKRMQDTETPVKRPPVNPFMCAVCMGPENRNKYHKPERFVRCCRCRRKAHPSCIGMSSVMYNRVQLYKWQCSECKLCMKCNRKPSAIDSRMVYCDQCDRGYHLACKGLRNLPEGRWHCSICTVCGMCGAQTPEGQPNPHLSAQQRQQLAMVAEWTHEYGLNELTSIREHLRTLCVPCVRQRKQSQQQQPSAESTAILNNNNNAEPRKVLGAMSSSIVGGGTTASVPGGGVISMKPQSS